MRDVSAQAAVMIALERIESGNLGMVKTVGGGVHEARIHHGPGYRAYLGFDGPVVVVLLCGGDKSTQKKDLVVAKKYWQDYRNRRKRGCR